MPGHYRPATATVVSCIARGIQLVVDECARRWRYTRIHTGAVLDELSWMMLGLCLVGGCLVDDAVWSASGCRKAVCLDKTAARRTVIYIELGTSVVAGVVLEVVALLLLSLLIWHLYLICLCS